MHGDALNRHERIHSAAIVLLGKPIVKGTGIVSIAGHSPEVSEEAVPRLSRARGRAIVTFDRDHGKQAPGRRLPVPAGIRYRRQAPRHSPEVCEHVSGRLNRRMEPQRRIATADSGGIRQKLSDRRR